MTQPNPIMASIEGLTMLQRSCVVLKEPVMRKVLDVSNSVLCPSSGQMGVTRKPDLSYPIHYAKL